MRSRPKHRQVAPDRRQAAFTLAEVLAALAFMAIVIPVAVEGMRVASRAGELGQRQSAAGRIAARVLNEQVVTGGLLSSDQNGVAAEGATPYRWTLHVEPWSEDAMRLVTVQVTFQVQGREHEVRLSTLVPNSTP